MKMAGMSEEQAKAYKEEQSELERELEKANEEYKHLIDEYKRA